MMWKRRMSGWLARGLMLLGVVLLVAAPMTPALATPMACCADMPCHDKGKPLCPEACVVACQIVIALEPQVTEPIRRDAPRIAAEIAPLPPGRVLAPDLPPPR